MFVMQQVLQEHACEPISECFSMHHHAKRAAPDLLGGLVTSSRLGEGSSVRESREPLPRRLPCGLPYPVQDKCPPTVQDAQHILRILGTSLKTSASSHSHLDMLDELHDLRKSCMEHHLSDCLRLVSRLFSGSMPSDPYTRSDSLCKKIKSFSDNTQAKAKSSNFADDMMRRSIYPQAALTVEVDKVTVGKAMP